MKLTDKEKEDFRSGYSAYMGMSKIFELIESNLSPAIENGEGKTGNTIESADSFIDGWHKPLNLTPQSRLDLCEILKSCAAQFLSPAEMRVNMENRSYQYAHEQVKNGDIIKVSNAATDFRNGADWLWREIKLFPADKS